LQPFGHTPDLALQPFGHDVEVPFDVPRCLLVHRPSCRASLAPTLISIVTAFLFRGTRFFLVIAQKVVLSRGGLFLQGDAVTESLEFSDEMALGLFGVGSAQVFGAEVVVGNIFLEDVPRGDEDGVGHGDDGLLGSFSAGIGEMAYWRPE
jgi:hypothetical protein